MKYFEVYDKDAVRVKSLLDLASRSSTATGTGIDISDYEGVLSIFVHSANTSQGTLSVKIETSHDDSTYVTLNSVTGASAFTTITTSNGALFALNFNTEVARKYIRAVGTIAGSAVVTYAVYFMGKKDRTYHA